LGGRWHVLLRFHSHARAQEVDRQPAEMCHPVNGQTFPSGYARPSSARASSPTKDSPVGPSRCSTGPAGRWSSPGWTATCARPTPGLSRPRFSHDGELFALLNDRRTYELDGGRLYRRDSHSIARRPPTELRPVLAEHRCGDPIPARVARPTRTPPASTDPNGVLTMTDWTPLPWMADAACREVGPGPVGRRVPPPAGPEPA